MPTDEEREERCLLPAICQAVGLPPGAALSVVLHRIGKIQEAWRQYEKFMAARN